MEGNVERWVESAASAGRPIPEHVGPTGGAPWSRYVHFIVVPHANQMSGVWGVQPRGKFEFVIERIVAESPEVRVENAALQSASPGQTFRITQRIAMPADQKSVIQFYLRTAKSSFVVPVEISYRGEVVKRE